MTPLAKSQNLAARMGRWSAAHRKTAIFGWLAFVFVAVALGSVIGTKSLDPADSEAGDSGRALQIIDRGGFDDTVDESVFVESESLRPRAPSSRPSSPTSSPSSPAPTASPASARRLDDPALVSPDGHAVLVQYDLSDAGAGAVDRIEPILDSAAADRGRQPGLHRRRVRLRER